MTGSAVDVESVCRACIAPFCGDEKDLLRKPELLDLFTRLSMTKVDADDKLPKSICTSCYNRLNDFRGFQTMCIESYANLLDRYTKNFFKEEIPESYPVKNECETIESVQHTNDDDQKESSLDVNFIDDNIGHHNDDDDDDDDNKEDIELDPLNDYNLKLVDPIAADQVFKEENKINKFRDIESDDEVLANIVRKSKQQEKNTAETCDLEPEKSKENNDSGVDEKEVKSRRRKKAEDNESCEKSKSEKQRKRENPYVCSRCPKTFMKKEVFEGHMRQHEGLKPFECEHCKKKYSRLERLKNHVLNDHSEKQMRFCCEVEGCDKKYRNRETLKRHINTHFNPPKPPVDKSDRPVFICELCGKQLSTKGVLKEHEMMHKGEFPYACEVCPRRFRVPNKLYLHKLRHQGIKNFECKICGLKKTTNKELKSHMNVHTREKQYPCKICNIIFLTNGNLVRHVQVVHDGIKLYACQYCDKAFGKAETLRNHTMKHTGERPLQCPHCERRFISRTSLQYHVKKHEKDGAEAENPCSNSETATECNAEQNRDENQAKSCDAETTNEIVEAS